MNIVPLQMEMFVASQVTKSPTGGIPVKEA
jgi:hypothetical protein